MLQGEACETLRRLAQDASVRGRGAGRSHPTLCSHAESRTSFFVSQICPIVAPRLHQTEKFDFLFIDGTPKESLAYLKAAEPLLAPGAVVVCDNVQARRFADCSASILRNAASSAPLQGFVPGMRDNSRRNRLMYPRTCHSCVHRRYSRRAWRITLLTSGRGAGTSRASFSPRLSGATTCRTAWK